MKGFNQKAHYEVHKNRTNPCKKQSSMEELVEQKVQEVLLKTNLLIKIPKPAHENAIIVKFI